MIASQRDQNSWLSELNLGLVVSAVIPQIVPVVVVRIAHPVEVEGEPVDLPGSMANGIKKTVL